MSETTIDEQVENQEPEAQAKPQGEAEPEASETGQEEPQGAPAVDWKAEARKWEARAKDNKADPMSIVRVFRMKSTKKNRSAVISAVGSFSVNSNTMDYLRFSAEKYGESSYRLTFDERPAGEYGIIVSNPNNVDEKMVIVSAFAIDGGAAAKE